MAKTWCRTPSPVRSKPLTRNATSPRYGPGCFGSPTTRALDLLQRARAQSGQPSPLRPPAKLSIPRVRTSLLRNAGDAEEAIEAAVEQFTELPVVQKRSAVILKDILDLVLAGNRRYARPHRQRGEGSSRARTDSTEGDQRSPAGGARPPSPNVARYGLALFNRRGWAEPTRDACRRCAAAFSRRIRARVSAADVGMFFGVYSRVPPARLSPAWLGDREVIRSFGRIPAAAEPTI